MANKIEVYFWTPGMTNYAYMATYSPIPSVISYMPTSVGWHYFYIDFLYQDPDGNVYFIERKTCHLFYSNPEFTYSFDTCTGFLFLQGNNLDQIYGYALYDNDQGKYIYSKTDLSNNSSFSDNINISELEIDANNNIYLHIFYTPESYCEYSIGNIPVLEPILYPCFLDNKVFCVVLNNPYNYSLNIYYDVKDNQQNVIIQNNYTLSNNSSIVLYHIIPDNQASQDYIFYFLLKNNDGIPICSNNINIIAEKFYDYNYEGCTRNLSIDVLNNSCFDYFIIDYEIYYPDGSLFQSGTIETSGVNVMLPAFLTLSQAQNNAGDWKIKIIIKDNNNNIINSYINAFNVFNLYIEFDNNLCDNIVYNTGIYYYSVPFYIFSPDFNILRIEYYLNSSLYRSVDYTLTPNNDFQDYLLFDINGDYIIKMFAVYDDETCLIIEKSFSIECPPIVNFDIQNRICEQKVQITANLNYITSGMTLNIKVMQGNNTIFVQNNVPVTPGSPYAVATVNVDYSSFLPYLNDVNTYEIIAEIVDNNINQVFSTYSLHNIYIYNIENNSNLLCKYDFVFYSNSNNQVTLSAYDSNSQLLANMTFTPSSNPGSPFTYSGSMNLCTENEADVYLSINNFQQQCLVYQFDCGIPPTFEIRVQRKICCGYIVTIDNISDPQSIAELVFTLCDNNGCGPENYFSYDPNVNQYFIPYYNANETSMKIKVVLINGCEFTEDFALDNIGGRVLFYERINIETGKYITNPQPIPLSLHEGPFSKQNDFYHLPTLNSFDLKTTFAASPSTIIIQNVTVNVNNQTNVSEIVDLDNYDLETYYIQGSNYLQQEINPINRTLPSCLYTYNIEEPLLSFCLAEVIDTTNNTIVMGNMSGLSFFPNSMLVLRMYYPKSQPEIESNRGEFVSIAAVDISDVNDFKSYFKYRVVLDQFDYEVEKIIESEVSFYTSTLPEVDSTPDATIKHQLWIGLASDIVLVLFYIGNTGRLLFLRKIPYANASAPWIFFDTVAPNSLSLYCISNYSSAAAQLTINAVVISSLNRYLRVIAPLLVHTGIYRPSIYYNPYSYNAYLGSNRGQNVSYIDNAFYVYFSINSDEKYVNVLSNVVDSNTPNSRGWVNGYYQYNTSDTLSFLDTLFDYNNNSSFIPSPSSLSLGNNIFYYSELSNNIQSIDNNIADPIHFFRCGISPYSGGVARNDILEEFTRALDNINNRQEFSITYRYKAVSFTVHNKRITIPRIYHV